MAFLRSGENRPPFASHDIYHIMVSDIMVQPDLGCTLEADGIGPKKGVTDKQKQVS